MTDNTMTNNTMTNNTMTNTMTNNTYSLPFTETRPPSLKLAKLAVVEARVVDRFGAAVLILFRPASL